MLILRMAASVSFSLPRRIDILDAVNFQHPNSKNFMAAACVARSSPVGLKRPEACHVSEQKFRSDAGNGGYPKLCFLRKPLWDSPLPDPRE